jgi:glyoxylase-like metal-dependent hydrolase (beta-lactamase superfamily II)
VGRAGVHCLTLETGFPLGSVNVYLVEGDPLTLVDCGPRGIVTRRSLESGLGAIGRSLDEVELLLLTHQHVDHHGMAHDLIDEFGIEVACLDSLAWYLERWPETCAADMTHRAARIRRHGMPAAFVTAFEAQLDRRIGEAAAIDVGRRLREGDIVDLGQTQLRVLHRPGHSPSDTVFWADDGAFAFVGDHLLLRISANPLMALGIPWESRFRPLLEYRRSLAKTKETALGMCFTGHGPTVVDHVELVSKRVAEQDERSGLIEAAFQREPGRTAWDVAHEVFGAKAHQVPILCLSEVVAHIERLEEENRLVRSGSEVVRFAPA